MQQKKEYNPIQGDILAFLNEATASVAAPKADAPLAKPAEEAHKPGKKASKALNLGSEDMFPVLGEGMASDPPSTGSI